MDRFATDHFGIVITVCDKIAERYPIFPGDPQRIHRSFEDPTLELDPILQRRTCEHVANGLAGPLRIWIDPSRILAASSDGSRD